VILRQATAASAGIALALLASAALAAPPRSEAQLRYQQERAACFDGTSNQDRATCLKEAGAALQESKRGALDSGGRSLEQNQLARCSGLPAGDRGECEMRILAGSTSGSARDGGILRELTSPVPAR
jgi:hypothetical protein